MTQELESQLSAAYGRERFTMTVDQIEVRAGVRRRRRRSVWAVAGALVAAAAAGVVLHVQPVLFPGTGPRPGVGGVSPTVTAETITAAGPVQVELDVYSGRPNPTWTLSRQETSELARRLQGLIALTSVPTLDNNLGYRGFLLHNLTPGISPGAEAHVYNGIVIITDQGHARAYPDSHGLEQWLIDQARAHGEADTLKAIGK